MSYHSPMKIGLSLMRKGLCRTPSDRISVVVISPNIVLNSEQTRRRRIEALSKEKDQNPQDTRK